MSSWVLAWAYSAPKSRRSQNLSVQPHPDINHPARKFAPVTTASFLLTLFWHWQIKALSTFQSMVQFFESTGSELFYGGCVDAEPPSLCRDFPAFSFPHFLAIVGTEVKMFPP